jgi:Flp pilus assembly protein TadD
VRRLAAILIAVVACAVPAAGQASPRASTPAAGAAAVPAELDTLWQAYRAARQGGDATAARVALSGIRQLRVERNILDLEPLALAIVAEGRERLRDGDVDGAFAAFRDARAIAPHLPDARFGLAAAEGRRLPLGVLAALREAFSGLTAPLPTALGGFAATNNLLSVALVAALLGALGFGAALLVRYGPLLQHDLEEALGPRLAPGLLLTLVLLPTALLQGWGWLPLWWMALVAVYAARAERAVAMAFVALAVLLPPIALERQPALRAAQNPQLRAALRAVEAGPDSAALATLEQARLAAPQDRDLCYLSGLLLRKAGRAGEAEALYRELLARAPQDGVALNNLGNLEFARGDYQNAVVRYSQGLDAGGSPRVQATLAYNLSLARLQRFEYQPAEEARSRADALAPELTQRYDRIWRFQRDELLVPTVVDLGLLPEELWAKYQSRSSGPGRENVLGGAPVSAFDVFGYLRALPSRFLALPLGFLALALLVGRLRGPRAFTERCLRCGTTFCNRCQLGGLSGSLCTQCHHIFVIRDGISAPARVQKLGQVHVEEERRQRLFRRLSLIVPGTGHLVARATLSGIALLAAWAVVVAALVVDGRGAALTRLGSGPGLGWLWGGLVLALVVIYAVASLLQPGFEAGLMPARRPRRPAA